MLVVIISKPGARSNSVIPDLPETDENRGPREAPIRGRRRRAERAAVIRGPPPPRGDLLPSPGDHALVFSSHPTEPFWAVAGR
jgi:hypothetical protein